MTALQKGAHHDWFEIPSRSLSDQHCFLGGLFRAGHLPDTGDPVSANDPVQDMGMPTYVFRGESR